jgi:hypothetical protein
MEIWHSGKRVLERPRLVGRSNHHIDYRHIIDSLLRKSGAFTRFRHKEDLFPSRVWHLAFDELAKHWVSGRAKRPTFGSST